MNLDELLERGYFPKELPPPFGTESFAAAVCASGASGLPGHFGLANTTQRPPRSFPMAHPVRYSHARGGLLRRQLSIPNPVHHFLLCAEIAAHWNEVKQACGGTPLAATAPRFSRKGRAIQGKHGLADKKHLALKSRANRRFVLRTDVSRFYHSIYTHAIPWAMQGKSVAKANRRFSVLSNRLDYWVPSGQDGQTVGIPIGPDTSLVFAEMLMQRCDEKLADDVKGLRGFRYIDDYELSFAGKSEAEDSYHLLERALGGFELALNPKKTEVFDLPRPLGETWSTQLRKFIFSEKPRQQISDLHDYFELAFELDSGKDGFHILHYALGRLRSLSVDASNWSDFQRMLLLCGAPVPSSLPFVFQILAEGANAGLEIEKELLEELINTILISHGELPHSSEVAWALWGALAMSIDLSSEAAMWVSECDDSVVAILALHAEEQGLFATPLSKTSWLSNLSTEGLYGPQWLLAYEASVQGWLQPADGSDHIGADCSFKFLRDHKVRFYEREAAVAPSDEGPIPSAKPDVFSQILSGFY